MKCYKFRYQYNNERVSDCIEASSLKEANPEAWGFTEGEECYDWLQYKCIEVDDDIDEDEIDDLDAWEDEYWEDIELGGKFRI